MAWVADFGSCVLTSTLATGRNEFICDAVLLASSGGKARLPDADRKVFLNSRLTRSGKVRADLRDFSSKPTASEGLNGLDLRQETENGPSQRL